MPKRYSNYLGSYAVRHSAVQDIPTGRVTSASFHGNERKIFGKGTWDFIDRTRILHGLCRFVQWVQRWGVMMGWVGETGEGRRSR
jgi:hypothetical protein